MGDVPAEPERFFFVHIQKTAGTTLKFALVKVFGKDAVYPSRADFDAVGTKAVTDVDYLRESFDARRDELRVITGHFPLCTGEKIGVPFRCFTVLRHPVDRTLSSLRNTQRRVPDLAAQPLEAIYGDPMRFALLLDNPMVRVLSLTTDEMTNGTLTWIPIDEDRLAVAKRNLVERIEILGLQPYFDVFCEDLNARYGWNLSEQPVTNATEPQPVSDEFRSRIAADNAFDLELYEFAEQLWYERHPEIPPQ